MTSDDRTPGALDDVDAMLLRLSRIAVAATVRAGAAVEPALSPTQVRVLTVLAAAGSGLSLAAVAEHLAASAPSASRLCQRLVRDGLVVRAAGAGNCISLSLSPAGHALLAEVNRARLRHLRPLFDSLDPRSRAAASTALEQLLNAVGDGDDTW